MFSRVCTCSQPFNHLHPQEATGTKEARKRLSNSASLKQFLTPPLEYRPREEARLKAAGKIETKWYVCGSQRQGRDGKAGSRELSRKQQGRVNVTSGPGYICVVGEKRLKEANVVDTKESGGRQYVEVR